MLTLRYIFRLIVAFFVRFRFLLLLGLFLGILVFTISSWIMPLVFGGEIERIGMVGRFRTETLPETILEGIGDGLTTMDEAGTVIPNLAQSWESPDKGKTWIFHLNSDYSWQDGEKIESSDLSYEYTDVKVEAPDSQTIIFKLETPFSPFPAVVSRPVFKKGLLGTGEWRVDEVSIAGGFLQKLVIVSDAKDKKVFKFYPTEERAKLAYKLGEVDKLSGIFNSQPFSSWKNTKVGEVIDSQKEVVLFFNTEDKILSDKNIRQALSYGVDKKALPGKRAMSPIAPNSWAYNPQVKPYEFDIERARELLEDVPEEISSELTIKLVTSPILLEVAERVAKDWEELGVKTSVQVSSGVPTEYQALLAIYEIPKDPDQYSIWHSTQVGSNISKYKDPRIDKLLESGRTELSLEDRRTIYLDFQRFLLEDAPAIFLYHPKSFDIERK
ncbi:hypothetical protein A2V56_03815 [Candidatus Woesebacteria bacterium RBG_19FT_COMBO_42_9]|uniref:Solute-binding protein family 5 domain-containing protein n=1 Tax=Candidatus Woesebacteria bacterium RBG_16_42_24 TaxID=1802485 RepID=A0A1F7XK98_9BACT|nr:MAG: hypothetical protein A2V97_00425 [Candidatus Woesebacteria bacterium RBG_16_42_24]OGM17593.1 MAG: hypothetical protein A2V56_03815 [Candidatus Woesebacteria bacterium RBG_19FT_COMBO_42_9]OGM67100.1 MAG: hypothetical protein A2985_02500 [Candidatus Woesebacteria bacterium RIFCSPLOWO2_01_FULL_43_11]